MISLDDANLQGEYIFYFLEYILWHCFDAGYDKKLFK